MLLKVQMLLLEVDTDALNHLYTVLRYWSFLEWNIVAPLGINVAAFIVKIQFMKTINEFSWLQQ